MDYNSYVFRNKDVDRLTDDDKKKKKKSKSNFNAANANMLELSPGGPVKPKAPKVPKAPKAPKNIKVVSWIKMPKIKKGHLVRNIFGKTKTKSTRVVTWEAPKD